MSLILSAMMPACVVVPDVADVQEGQPVVTILDDKADPQAIVPQVIERQEPFAKFDVLGATKGYNLSGRPLNYFWYYDYTTKDNIPLPFYSLCGDSPRCLFSVCTKPNPSKDSHRLLLVVSDSKLPPNAKDPYDFPTGAAFDAIQWQLTLTKLCPE